MATTTNLTTLKINYLTQAQYDTAKANNQINANEIYLTPPSADDVPELLSAETIAKWNAILGVGVS